MPTLTLDLGPEPPATLAQELLAAVRPALPPGSGPLQVVIRQGEDPAALVRAYLDAMERRDLPAARALLAEGFTMTFPGGVRLDSLEALVDWARPRYRFVAKTYEAFEVAGGAVYCFGTLQGEWPDGTPFAGIRFIDRFEVAGGRLTRQDVWNDMGEVRA